MRELSKSTTISVPHAVKAADASSAGVHKALLKRDLLSNLTKPDEDQQKYQAFPAGIEGSRLCEQQTRQKKQLVGGRGRYRSPASSEQAD